jgi:hypothetical protein
MVYKKKKKTNDISINSMVIELYNLKKNEIANDNNIIKPVSNYNILKQFNLIE